MYHIGMTEKDFDPNTMTRATREDICRMYLRLWGWYIVVPSMYKVENGEYLDLTQSIGE